MCGGDGGLDKGQKERRIISIALTVLINLVMSLFVGDDKFM